MSYEITGKRHLGSSAKKKQGMLNAWKRKARRKIKEGYPIEEPFKTREEVEAYLNSERIICLLCGRPFKMLCSHLCVHGITADQYKEKYGIPYGAGLTCIDTNTLLIQHGKKLVEDGKFRPPTDEERSTMYKGNFRRTSAKYHEEEMIERLKNQEPKEPKYTDEDYWSILENSKKECIHPLEYIEINKNKCPQSTNFHKFKKNNLDFQKMYYETIEQLPFHTQLKHEHMSQQYIEKLRELKSKRMSNAEISKLLNLHENTIEKHIKKLKITKPEPITCKNGHPYPGKNKHCQPCNTEKARERYRRKNNITKFRK